MVFERPNRKEQPQQPSPAIQRNNLSQPRRVITTGGNNGGNSNSSGSGGNGGRPSPWLDPENEPNPAATASFVEYLRWMRSPDNKYKDPTKVQILQLAEDKANYCERLTQLTERTKLIAGEGNYFQVKSAWRIRVGGHRGPESILLPAFDALGMPYLPSSTLRGVARCQAIQELIAKGVSWKEAEKRVAPYFGSLDAKNPSDTCGKVIFLDAYPLANRPSGGLTVDIANNIRNWENALKYRPNPNPFISLKESTFLIGLRKTASCNDDTLNQVKEWLIKGLQLGIGSQVNTGYGRLDKAGKRNSGQGFFRIDFNLEGQLIHGRQKFTQWKWSDRYQEWQMRGIPDAEVRPVAFKSMLRYWFRTFALGVLPTEQVKKWEATLFGAIKPQKRGWIKVEIINSKLIQKEPRASREGKQDPCGEQAGTLVLDYTSEAPFSNQNTISQLFKNLTWLMFHLGGIGQGARRPCYSRASRENAPWWRGSTLIPDSAEEFWNLPSSCQQFQQLFKHRLEAFYQALAKIIEVEINPRSPLNIGTVAKDKWTEAIDGNCCIVVCAGEANLSKPFALATLHSQELKFHNDYDGNLCGKVGREVKPSPVWIADLGDYQVVTIFGVDRELQNPRNKYLKLLRDKASSYAQIWSIDN